MRANVLAELLMERPGLEVKLGFCEEFDRGKPVFLSQHSVAGIIDVGFTERNIILVGVVKKKGRRK